MDEATRHRIRAAAARAQAAKQADLMLFYSIMSADFETLHAQCTRLGLDGNGLSDYEIRRLLLHWHRTRGAGAHLRERSTSSAGEDAPA